MSETTREIRTIMQWTRDFFIHKCRRYDGGIVTFKDKTFALCSTPELAKQVFRDHTAARELAAAVGQWKEYQRKWLEEHAELAKTKETLAAAVEALREIRALSKTVWQYDAGARADVFFASRPTYAPGETTGHEGGGD